MAGFAHAEAGYKKGKVKNIRTHHLNQSSWPQPMFWFTVEGVATAGNCPQWHGNILFVGDSEQVLSMVLATYMSGGELAVRYDDSLKAPSGHCFAQYVTLGDPAPLH